MDNKMKEKTKRAPESNLLKFAAGALLFFMAIPVCSLLANIKEAIEYGFWQGVVIYCILFLVILFFYIKWIRGKQSSDTLRSMSEDSNTNVSKAAKAAITKNEGKTDVPHTPSEPNRIWQNGKFVTKMELSAEIGKEGKFSGDIVRKNGALAVKDLKVKGDIQGLVKALKDSDGNVRRTAAQMLGELKDSSAVEPLIAVLTHDVLSDVREAAAKALSQIGGGRAIEALVDATAKLLEVDPRKENIMGKNVTMNKLNKAAFICSKGDFEEPKCKEVAQLLSSDVFQHMMAYDNEIYFFVNPNITLPDFNKKTDVEKFLITAFKANGIDTPNDWQWSKSGLFERYGYTFVVFLVQSKG